MTRRWLGTAALLVIVMLGVAGCAPQSVPAAGHSLFGRAYDASTGAVVIGAQVHLNGRSVPVSSGSYSIGQLAPGSYLLSVSAPGYWAYEAKVSILVGDITVDAPLTEMPASTQPPPVPPSRFSADDLDLLARLVRAEAGGEPYQGQVAVAATVFHRVDSPEYPNTIPGVVYQVVDGLYTQYEPVLNGTIDLPADDSARRAVQDALNGVDPSRGAIGFFNPDKTSNAWVRSRPVTVTIGNHVFFR